MIEIDEYSKLDATALAALVRTGELTSQMLARAAHTAHELANPVLNTTSELYLDRINEPSCKPDAAFTGVPFLLKDAGSAEGGRAQHCGSRLGLGYVADRDDPLVARYRDSGLNLIGRSTTPELAMAATTESELTGASRNPWLTTHSTGGSSGGAAAAVAAGIVPVAHGTDIGGSIRIPAACCGVVGFKPGQSPLHAKATQYGGLLVEHVLTRSVRDTSRFLALTANHPPSTDLNCTALRVAVWNSYQGIVPIDSDVVTAVNEVASILDAMGHSVEEATPSFDEQAWRAADDVVWTMSTAQEAMRLAGATGHTLNQPFLEPPVLEAVQQGRQRSKADWQGAMEVYAQLRQQVGTFFTRYDVLLTPTTVTPAPALDTINSNRNISYTQFMDATAAFCPHTAIFNVTGQPAISLPLGTHPSGLPIGVQLVTAVGAEGLLLQLSAVLEEAMPWSKRLPPNHVTKL